MTETVNPTDAHYPTTDVFYSADGWNEHEVEVCATCIEVQEIPADAAIWPCHAIQEEQTDECYWCGSENFNCDCKDN